LFFLDVKKIVIRIENNYEIYELIAASKKD